jgi:putative ABC transport system substrate-binding protein
VIKVCTESKIPLYAGEPESVRSGCIATLGLSYYELGKQTGAMAARILRDKADPAVMPVETQKYSSLVLNPGAAELMGVKLPKAVLDRAQEIVR